MEPDIFADLRAEIARVMRGAQDICVGAQDIYCAAGEFGARTAAPLMLDVDARAWAARLDAEKDAFVLYGAPLVAQVSAKDGHIVFTFTDAFYTAALCALLDGLADKGALPLATDSDAALAKVRMPRAHIKSACDVLARISYVQRRMWMLARHACGPAVCPDVREVRRALLLTAGALEAGAGNRPARALDACDALLGMTRAVPLKARRAHMRACAHVGAAAARALHACYSLYRAGGKE